VSSSYVSAELRRLVADRADHLCEYCLIHQEDTFFGCGVDHILSRKHGGPSQEENLAYACMVCNSNKGSDIASLVPGIGELVRLFNPRIDRWRDHFRLDRAMIVPLTEIGEATVRILGFNQDKRLLEREALQDKGRYPLPPARSRMLA
jgi:hypothetical protein